MLKLKTALILSVSIALFSIPAHAHKVKWVNGTTYDYDVLIKGKDCCSGVHCRPAFEFKPNDTGWTLRIPEKGDDPKSDVKIVRVDEMRVTYVDLNNDGVAHTCGYFDYKGGWEPYCTFIPRNGSAFIDEKRRVLTSL
jgi:hypothetical protein